MSTSSPTQERARDQHLPAEVQALNNSDLTPAEVYRAIGENYRYFLSWRAQLLAGYFALLAGLGVAFTWLQTLERKHASFLVPAAALFLTLLFWALEWRNREAYRAYSTAGGTLEKAIDVEGGYYRVANLKATLRATHSNILNIMFALFALAFAVAAWVFWKHGGAF